MENKVKFFNTLTRKVETVIPNEDGKIAMYTCGFYNDFAYFGIRNLSRFYDYDWRYVCKKEQFFK